VVQERLDVLKAVFVVEDDVLASDDTQLYSVNTQITTDGQGMFKVM